MSHYARAGQLFGVIPTVNTLAEMKARQIPFYLIRNASWKNFRGFVSDLREWYYMSFLETGRRDVLLHLVIAGCIMQLVPTIPHRRWHVHHTREHGKH
eukprot:TRINITY_DN22555_c0_g1_i1.p1 TRINITY_DN22555_c0_g1~~TRINITY_DN22555_c0_g1_i1.p1  ORF type:complete len:113 (+),score=17.69 TRINITY_DN22555_c0_g1_i1:47-340(+)